MICFNIRHKDFSIKLCSQFSFLSFLNYLTALPQNLHVFTHDNRQMILDPIFQRLPILLQVLQPQRLYLNLSTGVRSKNRRQTICSHRDVTCDQNVNTVHTIHDFIRGAFLNIEKCLVARIGERPDRDVLINLLLRQ